MRSSLLILRPQPDFVARVHFGQGLELYRFAGAEVADALAEYVREGRASLDCSWLGQFVEAGSGAAGFFQLTMDSLHQNGGPEPPPGEALRAVQMILGPRGGEFRLNHSIRGALQLDLCSPAENKITVTPRFRLHEDEGSEATHCTIIQWPQLPAPRALIDWNFAPSMIRRASDSALDSHIGPKLPRGARRRWRGLVRSGNAELIRSAVWRAREASPEKFYSKVLEYLEQDVRAGLPSRRSGIEMESLETAPAAEVVNETSVSPEHSVPDMNLDLSRAMRSLPRRTIEIIGKLSAGFTQAEIASELGISQQAVSKAKVEAYALLRQQLAG